jgi:membrane protein DedA with SNARE-associated domain
MTQAILPLFLTSLSFFLFVPFSAFAGTELGTSDPISKYQDIIIAIISVGVGSLIATLLVQYWNNKKETNEKRRTDLNNLFIQLHFLKEITFYY